jgi:hypothetical protein
VLDPLSELVARSIARKHGGLVPTDTLDIAALASVEVTSEEELYPVDHLFDGRDGPGGSCWVASSAGPQVIVLRFTRPIELLGTVVIESEERSDTRKQTIELSGWSEHRQRPFEYGARTLEYKPYGSSFHRASWDVAERDVTHLRLRVTPERSRERATLTAVILRRGEP